MIGISIKVMSASALSVEAVLQVQVVTSQRHEEPHRVQGG